MAAISFNPQGKAVLVTGASSGIGREIALQLHAFGFTVFAGVRKKADAETLLEKNAPTLIPVFLDVTDAAQVEACFANIQQQLAHSDVLWGIVNNAGVVISAPLEHLSTDTLMEQFQVNVMGQHRVTRAALPLLRQSRGRIVMMSSIAGRHALPIIGPYCASKSALEALSDAFRMELRHAGIQVSIIQPGRVRTPIWEKSLRQAEQLSETFSASLEKEYARAYDYMKKRIARSSEKGISPSVVADAVHHALTASKPKTRYLVGWDAKCRVLLEWLPDRWADALVLSQIGL